MCVAIVMNSILAKWIDYAVDNKLKAYTLNSHAYILRGFNHIQNSFSNQDEKISS